MDGVPDLVLPEDVAERLTAGVAAVAATADATLRPVLGRVWGIEVVDGRAALRISVEAPIDGRMHANLLRGGTLALTATVPTTYRSFQVKGPIREARPPTASERARTLAHHAMFCAEAVQVGVPVDRADRFMWEDALMSVSIAVRELYDQTPGPAAGGRL
jgi:hypothetical protein